MKCPFCGFADTKVIDSRSADSKKRRRRECGKCLKRFTTYEIVEIPLFMVEKRDGSFEPFNRNKLINGIYNAIKKRPVSMKDVSKIADDIESVFEKNPAGIMSSEAIGDLVLEKLKKLDSIAYIRFASVYKDFTDLESFVKMISEFDGK